LEIAAVTSCSCKPTAETIINGELVEVKTGQAEASAQPTGDYPAGLSDLHARLRRHFPPPATRDEVLVVASSRSLPAINQQQFYVSISRGRERCQVSR